MKNHGSAQTVIDFTITEINYLVEGFTIWWGRFCIHVWGIKFFGCAIPLVSGIARKAATLSPLSIAIFWKAPIKPSYF